VVKFDLSQRVKRVRREEFFNENILLVSSQVGYRHKNSEKARLTMRSWLR
jgi:hypothetical protein